ncbi:MAG TPA: PhoU domain-containing protein [Calditrichia bacterium]|nr:PhoU domain-containing protein [Calditrichota bacterium]HQV33400.1 PhoU domain-containing protein [Calditrichia bacterium]
MLRELLSVFKQDSKLDQAYEESYEMLSLTRDMYLKSRKSLRESNNVDLDNEVFSMDKRVNKFEKNVRRSVLQHLSVRGTQDLSSGLILVSVIIDIERIGDYTKNIIDLAANHPGRLEGGEMERDLQRIEGAVEDIFKRLINCLKNGGNEKEAEAILKEYFWVNPVCDQMVNNLIKESYPDLSSGEAVTLAMYFRYLKRISAHLQNITTSLTNPFHKIGFVPKRIKKGPPEAGGSPDSENEEEREVDL